MTTPLLSPFEAGYLQQIRTPALMREAEQRARNIGVTAVNGIISAVPFGSTVADLTGVSDTARRAAADAASGAVNAQGSGFFNWVENLWSGFVSMIVRFLGNYLGLASTNTAVGNALLARESTANGPVLSEPFRQHVQQAAAQASPARSDFPPPPPEVIGTAVARAVADETMSTGSVISDGFNGAVNGARRLFSSSPRQESPQAFGERLAARAHASIARSFLAQHERPDLSAEQRQGLGRAALDYANRMTGMHLVEENGRTVLRPIEGPATGLYGYFRRQAELINPQSGRGGVDTTLPITVSPARRQQQTSLPGSNGATLASLAERALTASLDDADHPRVSGSLPNLTATQGRSISG